MAGAMVQGTVGLGLGLVAAPVVTLLEPALMPGLLLVLAALLPLVTLLGERDDIDWHGLNWSLPTRMIGTAGGVWLVAAADHRVLGVAVGVMVLIAVAITLRSVVVPINWATLAGAGLLGGVAGTATSIGGPPFALLYQHRPPRQVRTTMAVYFTVGAALSLVGLLLGGQLDGHQVRTALLLLPAVVVGALLAVPLRSRLDGPAFRLTVLAVCATSAVVLVVRSLA
jgi:uncharacterized membrane protein YfcA